MELLEIASAIQIIGNLKYIKELVTDALGSCHIASRRKKHPQLTNNYAAIKNPLKTTAKDFKGTLRWTPVHPEKGNRR